MSAALRYLEALLLATLLTACASAGSTPTPGRPAARFVAPGPSADRYSTEPVQGAALRGPHAVRVERGVARALRERAHALTPDARLGELCAWVLGALDARGSPPPYAVIDLWTHHLGLFEPAPHLLVLSQSDSATLEDRVASEVASLLQEQRYTHYGVATIEQGGSVFAVLALSWRWLQLSPVPRTLAPGASLELTGRLLYGLHDAQLAVSYPDGTSYRSEPQRGEKIALRLSTRGRGEHRVELLASSTLGDTVVANFPIYVGVAPVTEITVQNEAGASTLGEADSRRRLLDLVNRDRQHVGLSPLVLDDALSRVARAHSADMLEHGFVGHTSPTTGGPEDRIRRAGIRTPLVLENIGRGYSPDELHRGLMESPGHRQNLLNREVTHVGIGLALAVEDQHTAYLVTQLFARFASPIDVADAPAKLLLAINRERARRRLPALKPDTTMAALCGKTARDFFHTSAKSRQELVEQLNHEAASAHPPYSRLSALLTVVSSLDEAASIDALFDPRARAIALGVAQGTRTDTIENAIVLVALIGY
jgi:uncharacterized protein YkwD